MYLLFFVSRLHVESPRNKRPVIYLRYKAASDGCEDVDFKEHLLNYFCFPLGPEAVQPKEVQASEEYTFTLTHNDGQRFTGFCRQIFPPAPRFGSKARYPQVLCIVAENPWCNFFFKVLQVAEQLLKGFDGLLDSVNQDLPLESHLGAFVVDLRKQLATNPAPGEVLRLAVPNIHGLLGVSPPRYMGASSTGEALNWGNDHIELQVPPDCGNGKDNSGIPLARLLFHVPVEGMLTLVASLLLERRIVFVARSRDTVTAAVQAAQALIYPFKWHHIYLPLLPLGLVDYLSAPMPFLVGLTSEMLPLIRHIPMSEVTMVDLDLQKVSPAPGSQADDGRALPYGRQLGAALEAVFKAVRSPTEYESSPLITGVMQEYFVRLFGSYRRYIHEQWETLPRALPSAMAAGAPVTARGGVGRESGRGYKEARDGRGSSVHNGGNDNTLSPQAPLSSIRLHDDMLRGHGHCFDQPAFVAHRRNEAVRSFLTAMRHSQLYEMFIQERLQMAAAGAIDLPCSSHSYLYSGASRARRPLSITKSSSATNLPTLDKSSQGSAHGSLHASDMTCSQEPGVGFRNAGGAGTATCLQNPFELRVERYSERRRMLREHMRSLMGDAAAAGGSVGGGGGAKLTSKLRRHRRTDSEDLIIQPQPFGPLHNGESMRRITTYPGLVDVSTPTLDDPFSYFAECDLHEDENDVSASPYTIPCDGNHKRSESGNSLPLVDLADVGGVNGVPPPVAAGVAASFAFGARAERGGRERARDRDLELDNTPLRRLSVPMFSTSTKSMLVSQRAAPSNDSPGPLDRALAEATPTGGLLVTTGAGGAGSRMMQTTLHGNSGGISGGSDCAVAATVVQGGVEVTTMADGHKVYDGPFKSMLRFAAQEAKNNLILSLSGLASPLGSPRNKEHESAADRRTRTQIQDQKQPLAVFTAAEPSVPQQQPNVGGPAPQAQLQLHQVPQLAIEEGQQPGPPLVAVGSIPLPGMMPTPSEGSSRNTASDSGATAAGERTSAGGQPSTTGAATEVAQQQAQQQRASSASGAGHHLSSLLTAGFTGFKEKMAGAKAKALGTLPTPAYKPQVTGEKAAKFRAQLAGSGGANLVAGADGKLKQPHAPQRPLGLGGGPPGRSDLSEPLLGHGPLPYLRTPSFMTPVASPGGPGTAPEPGAPVEVSPYGPVPCTRAMSVGGIHLMSHLAGSQGAACGGGGAAAVVCGDWTPPTSGPLPALGTTWRASAPHVPPPSDWDPFGTGSAPPPAAGGGGGASFSGAASTANWSFGGDASATTTPFTVSAQETQPAVSTATPAAAPSGFTVPVAASVAAGSGSCDVTTADVLTLSPSALSGVSSGFALAAGSGAVFDPFAASDPVAPGGRLESAGSNDFAAFTSASSPRDFPGITLGAAPVVG